MEKLSKLFASLNKISKNILMYGMLITLVFIIISSILLKVADSIQNLQLAKMFLCNNVLAFCEVIIGSIIIDMFICKSSQ